MSYDTLFAMPSFIRGAARALDLGSTTDIYNESNSEREADYEALRLDWLTVGSDLYGALDDYEKKQEN